MKSKPNHYNDAWYEEFSRLYADEPFMQYIDYQCAKLDFKIK